MAFTTEAWADNDLARETQKKLGIK